MFHKRLMREFKDNQKYAAGMVCAQWVTLLANIILMFWVARFIGKIAEGNMVSQDLQYMVIVLAGVLFVRGVAGTVNAKLSHKASTAVKRIIRERVFAKLMELGGRYRDTISTSEAVQISTEGVEQLEIYFGKYVPQFFYSLLAPVTLFIIVGTMDMKVAVILLVCVPLIPVSIIAVQKFAKKMLSKYWGTYTSLGDTFLESLQGLTTLKIYQADGRYAKKMDEEAEKFRKITMKVLFMQLNSISVMDLVAYGGAAVGIILAVMDISRGQISLEQGFFIVMISAEFFLPLRLLGSFFHIAMNSNAAADKIFRLLDASVPQDGGRSKPIGNKVQFQNVVFGYEEGKSILNNVSFEVPDRGVTALTGTSGCGKSTIAALLMRDFKCGQGAVLVGDVNIFDLSREALYQKITRIRHDSYLFKGTLKENLKMGNEGAADSDMLHALKRVNLYNTVMEKGGLLMELEEQAANLSGGQKQRLALARAILKDSDIYIFDEATSNIDAESEDQIMKVIYQLAETKTVFLISHRLVNVARADRILVIKEAQIVEKGTHEELLAAGGTYAGLYDAQKELEKYAKGVA